MGRHAIGAACGAAPTTGCAATLAQCGMVDDSRHDHETADLKAGREASLLIDFDLEDIIAGNAPASAAGQALTRMVEDAQAWPTQGKIEAALIPLHEQLAAEAFARDGGTADPPIADRGSITEHANKVLQARKVRRAATIRAARPINSTTRTTPHVTRFQVAAIVGLLVLIAAVFYVKA